MRKPGARAIRSASAVLIGALATACGASRADEPPPRASDAVEIEASATTRNETGVARWSVARKAEDGVTGYGADGDVIVSLRHAAQVESDRQLDAFILSQNGESSHVVLEFERSGSVAVLDSAVSDTHGRTAELLADDLQSQGVVGGSSLTGASLEGLSIRGLQPLDDGNGPPLVNQDCVSLVNECNTALTTNNAAHAEFLTYCLSPSAVAAKCHPAPAGPGQPGKFIPLFPKGLGCTDCESCFDTACNNATAKQNEWSQAAQKCSTDPDFKRCSKTTHP